MSRRQARRTVWLLGTSALLCANACLRTLPDASFIPIVWSRDSSSIAYVRVAEEGTPRVFELETLDVATERRTVLYTSKRNLCGPAWSPGAATLACVEIPFRPGERAALLLFRGGSLVQRIALDHKTAAWPLGDLVGLSPVWRQDEKAVAVLLPVTREQWEREPDRLDLVGVDTSSGQELWRLEGVSRRPCAWSPDGSSVAVVRPGRRSVPEPRPGGARELPCDRLQVIRVPGMVTRDIELKDADVVVFPAWAPDGKSLAVGSGMPGLSDLRPAVHVIDTGTGKSRAHPVPGYVTGLSWSPDGRRLACSLSRIGPQPRSRLAVLDTESGELRELLVEPELVLGAASWAPNGQWIAARCSKDPANLSGSGYAHLSYEVLLNPEGTQRRAFYRGEDHLLTLARCLVRDNTYVIREIGGKKQSYQDPGNCGAQALRLLDEFAERYPRSERQAAARRIRASVHVARGSSWRWDKATGKATDKVLAEYSRAIEVDPACAAAYHDRAELRRREGKMAEARSDYEKAGELAGKDIEMLNELAKLYAFSREFHDPAKAVRFARQAVELVRQADARERVRWREAEYLNTLAWAHAEAGDFAAAIEAEEAAVAAARKAENLIAGPMYIDYLAGLKEHRTWGQYVRPPRPKEEPQRSREGGFSEHHSEGLLSDARHGYVRGVGQSLALRADPNACDSFLGRTALMHAARAGSAQCIKMLVKAGAEVDATDRDGWTALMHAAAAGTPESVGALLAVIPDVHAKTPGGTTALMLAEGRPPSDDREWIIDLLKEGIKSIPATPRPKPALTQPRPPEPPPTETTRLGRSRPAFLTRRPGSPGRSSRTPLVITAARRGDALAVMRALRLGEDVNTTDPATGETALLCAAEEYPEIVRLLIEAKADLNAKSRRWEETPLMRAATGDERSVSFLIEAGARVNARTRAGETALMYAAMYGRPGSVKQLLAAEARVEDVDNGERTPLMYAARGAEPESVKLLLQAGARINATDKEGWTPLMFAAAHGTPQIVEALIKAGADVNAKTRAGKTALQLAELNPSPDQRQWVAKLLKGEATSAPPSEPTRREPPWRRGTTAGTPSLLGAAGKGDATAVKRALASGADPNSANLLTAETALMLAAPKHPEIVRTLLEAGADVHATSRGGETALMRAAAGDEQSVQLLLQAGARVTARTGSGRTALMDAAEHGAPGTVTLLLAAKALVNTADNDEQTPLMCAARGGNPENVKLLLQAGAEIEAADEKGWTPLIHAAAKGTPAALKALLDAGAKVSVKADDGQSILKLARDNQDSDERKRQVIELLKRSGASE